MVDSLYSIFSRRQLWQAELSQYFPHSPVSPNHLRQQCHCVRQRLLLLNITAMGTIPLHQHRLVVWHSSALPQHRQTVLRRCCLRQMHLTALHWSATYAQLKTRDKADTILFNLHKITTEYVVHKRLALLQILEHLSGQSLNQSHRQLHSTLSGKLASLCPVPRQLQQRPIHSSAHCGAARPPGPLDEQIADWVQQDTRQTASPLHKGKYGKKKLVIWRAG
mmetsp:Transcript_35769/g.93627  ORF Transcript_35769/g.93627 Transcript_35769/m.93627 type:complete len:221 (-) Transcript_35769:996-1658(-)